MAREWRRKVENKANKLLNDYFEKVKKDYKASAIDPIDILECALGYDVEYDEEGELSSDVYAELYIEKKRVKVNNNIKKNDGMEYFTLAHEIGHIVLHYSLMGDKNTNSGYSPEFDNQKKHIEREADQFAAYLLMPKELIINAFIKIRKTPFKIRNIFFFRLVFKKSKRKSAIIFAEKVIKQGNFNVSKLAMLNRLISLGLVKGIKYQKNKVK
jgi:Zn-dependent peptidase ImmA (M78 family)